MWRPDVNVCPLGLHPRAGVSLHLGITVINMSRDSRVASPGRALYTLARGSRKCTKGLKLKERVEAFGTHCPSKPASSHLNIQKAVAELALADLRDSNMK